MKKSLIKDIFRDIKNNIGQFISIVIILAIGVSFYIGIQITGYFMRDVGNKYFDELKLSDVHVTTSLGTDQDTIDFLETQFPQSIIEPIIYHDVLVDYNGGHLETRLFHTTGTLDQYQLVEGKDIEQQNDIVVDILFKEYYQFDLGDTLKLIDDEHFVIDEFKITGFIQSVYFIDFNHGTTTIGDGSLEGFGYVHQDAIDTDDIYTVIAISFNDVAHDASYHADYQETLLPKINQLESLQDDIAQKRYDSITKKPLQEISDAQVTLDQEMTEALEKLDEARIQLEEGEQALADALNLFKEGVTEIYTQLNQPAIIAGNPLETINTLQTKVASFKQEQQTQLSQGLITIDNGLLELTQQEILLNEKQVELDHAQQEMDQLTLTIQSLQDSLNELNSLYGSQGDIDNLLVDRTFQDNLLDLQAISDHFELDLELQGKAEEFAIIRSLIPVEYSPLDELEQEYLLLVQQQQVKTSIQYVNQTLNDAFLTLASEAKVTFDADEDARVSFQNLNQALHLENQIALLENSQLQIDEGLEAIQENRNILLQSRDNLINTQSQLNFNFIKLDQGVNELEEAANLIQEGQLEIDQGTIDLQAGVKEVELERESAQTEIDNALKELNEIKIPTTYILDRADFVLSYQAFGDNSMRIEKIGQVLPLFFFLIAAMVSMTTIRRMVDEQITLMGIYKAIGYTTRDIQAKTMFFSILTLVLGLIMGTLFGYTFLPTIIYNAYRILYNLPDITTSFVPKYFWLPFILSILATVVVTWLNTFRVLQKSPAQLMRPQAPPAGKRVFLERISFIWKRLTFLHKVTVRNILRNKSRFFMTIIGVAGCTGLLITGFGLNDSIMGIPKAQFMELQKFDAMLTYDDDVLDFDQLNNSLSSFEVIEQEKAMTFNGRVENLDVMVVVFENDPSFKKIYHLKALDQSDLSLGHEGAILTKKAAALLGVTKGDTITLTNRDMDLSASIKIDNIAEYYVEHGLFLSESLAQAVGIDVTQNSLYLTIENSNRAVIDSLREKVLDNEGVYTLLNRYEILDLSNESMESFYIVIVVVIIASAALAFVVMYNLSSLNIKERERELATLKVLGFYPKETTQYVFRESILMTVIGILVGILFGIWLHRFVILSAELDNFGFVRELSLQSILISVILTFVFSYINELMMRPKIKGINMLSALKSVE